MRKLWNVLLVVFVMSLLFSVFPIESKAATSGYYTYSVSDGKATITDCDTSISGDITIPSTLDGYPVTTIGRSAFTACTKLTSVTIPDSVTRIEYSAFSDCIGMTSVFIPKSVISIYDYAFSYCTSLKKIVVDANNPAYSSDQYGVLFNKAKTRLIQAPGAISGAYVIPDSVTRIGSSSFRYCRSLTGVTIPDSVNYIGENAFRDCRSLTGVTIPAGVTRIESHTFAECKSLTSVTISDGVTSIGYAAFQQCISLTGVTIPDSVTNIEDSAFSSCSSLTSVNIPAGITSIDGSVFYNCSSLTSITIPDSVNHIGSNSFRNCTSLTSVYISDLDAWYKIDFVSSESNPLFNGANLYLNGALVTDLVIPDDVTSIGKNVFTGCSSLTSVTLHDNITSIGDWAFGYCSSLTSITIPDSVTGIGEWAFGYCSSLTGINIPDSVTSIGENAFYNCGSLAGIWVDENNLFYCSDPNGVLFNKDKTTLLAAPGGLSGAYAIPDGVTIIGENAFAYCASLTDIAIPDTVTSIMWDAFERCTSLTGVHISSLSAWCKIDFDYYISNPLYNNTADLYLNGEMVTDLVIPDDVTDLANYAFYNCSCLTSVNTGNCLTSIGYYAFYNCTNLTDLTIGDSVIDVDWDAFDECDNLTRLTIGDGVTSIRSSAFYYYPNLISVTIGDGVTNIGYKAFYKCPNLTNVTIGSNVTNIERQVFQDCTSLTSITIPDSVTSIGPQVFEGCTNLTRVAIGKGVTSIGEKAFNNCDNLTGVHISDVAAWCNISFENFTANPIYFAENLYLNDKLVTDLVIPDSVTSIHDELFRNCTSLTSVNIGNGVASIGHYAFLDCNNLIHVTVGDSVTSIGYMAFNCSNLAHVVYTGTQEQWKSISIGNRNVQLTHAEVMHYGDTEMIRTDNCVNAGLYCTACDDFLTRERAEDGVHSYEWTLVQPETFTSDGLREATCTICGETDQETLPMLVGDVSLWNVALSDDFLVKFYLQISECIESTGDVRIRVGGSVYTFPVSELEKTDDGLYVAKVSISASQMNESIYVTVIYGDEQSENGAYIVRQYADTILADESKSQYHALVKEMLHYGAMAQIYFGYNTENLANAGITDAAQTPVPETTEKMSIVGDISGAQYYGATLVFRDRIAVRFYFTGDVTGCTFTADGNTYTPVAKNGMHYIEIADILPQDLDQQITLTVTDEEGNQLSITYGPMNYIVRMNEKGSDPLKDLLKALYNYHLAAKALNA